MKLLKFAQFVTEVVKMQAWVLFLQVCLLKFSPLSATSLPQGISVSAPLLMLFWIMKAARKI